MGKLIANGTIDLTQFWPLNTKEEGSDGDTVKVVLETENFEYTNENGVTINSNVLFNAGVFDKNGKFKKHIKEKVVKVRLQGIDAPELHFENYCQNMGKTAAYELQKHLDQMTTKTENLINCQLYTENVYEPNDVFDRYGRFVGDIIFWNNKGIRININLWMIENSLAFPTYYDKMLKSEIDAINSKLKKEKINIWEFYSEEIAPIDKSLRFVIGSQYDAQKDKQKPVLFPKIFRRLVTYDKELNGSTFSISGFRQFLMKNQEDFFFRLEDYFDYLNQKLEYSSLINKKIFIYNLFDDSGKMLFEPNEIVFNESSTVLKDNNGNPILKF